MRLEQGQVVAEIANNKTRRLIKTQLLHKLIFADAHGTVPQQFFEAVQGTRFYQRFRDHVKFTTDVKILEHTNYLC